MRLLEQDMMDWKNMAPFLDTICIPVYRYQLAQKELYLEEVHLIEYITEELEKRLIGRILLLPACTFIGSDDQLLSHTMDSIRKELVHSGFHYSFLVILEGNLPANNEDPSFHVLNINKNVDRELELERVYSEILAVWQSI